MNDPLILEIMARGGAVGAFFGLALVTAKPPFSPARITGALFALGAAGHTLTQQPLIAEALGYALLPFWVLSLMGTGLFWAFATELFEDRTRLDPIRFSPALALFLIGLGVALSSGVTRTGLLLLHNLIGAALMSHVLVVVWKGWRNDLVESRRRLRGPILGAAAFYAVAVITVQIAEVLLGPASVLSPVAATALLILGLAGIAALLQVDTDLFAVARSGLQAAKATPLAPTVEDAKLAGKLEQLMRAECVYRDEQLSIGALALKVGVPEYRLRRLINQQLGYRNFNAYLNGWRLADAKLALGDPAQREVPISTIALDAGFQSLGPFNRAFKTETGLTPTEFRTRASGSTVG
jgi:AraC-like DNA-binding protein